MLKIQTGDVWGGLAAMLVALPSSIAFGVLVFSAIDPSLAPRGAWYGMLGAAAVGLVAPLLGGTRALISAPCAPAAAILAGLAALLTANGLQPLQVIALLGVTVMMTGLLQFSFGLLKGGRVIKYIPYPVVSGYLTGVGLIIALSQLPMVLGFEAGTLLGPAFTSVEEWRWPPLVVAVIAITVMVLAPRITRAMPAAVFALLAGAGAYLLLGLFVPGLLELDQNPLLIGTVTAEGSVWSSLSAQLQGITEVRLGDIERVAYSALALAALLSIDTLKTCVILDAVTHHRHDSNRELMGQGLANLTAFTIGGMPGAGTIGPTMVNVTSGGKTRWSGVIEGLFVVLAIAVLAPAIAWVPMAALAGILLVIASRMFDWSAFRLLRHKETRFDFAVVAVVAAVAVFIGLIAASVAGVALAILLFIRDQINGSVLRRRASLDQSASKTHRLEDARELLANYGHLGVMYELQGNLFFGTTDQLYSEVEADLRERRWLLMDLRRVQSLDYTAANLFRQMHARLAEHGGALSFCGMPSRLSQGQDIHRYLSRVGLVGGGKSGMRVFDSREDALEWIEDRILDHAGWQRPDEKHPLDLHEIELFADLDRDAVEQLRPWLREVSVKAGGYVFRHGDAGDELYLIRRGTVRILLPLRGGIYHHLANFGRGDFCGEMSFLDKGVRSADAVAKSALDLYAISRATFNEHVQADAVLGVRVFSRLARAVSRRLRQTDAEMRAVEDR
ncbi:MAG: SulP family inorganic anion transporter [Gammaproteobacteria bacterium]